VLDRWQSLAAGHTIRVAGDGVSRYREVLAAYLGSRFEPVEPLPPLAPVIARIAVREAQAGRGVAPHAVRPIYVRRSDAELARDRKPVPADPGQ
jgi:tRNA A37 threonylcarbamoyladenosine modification protein TsaB